MGSQISSIATLEDFISKKVADYRSIYRLIKSEKFQKIWALASKDARNEFVLLVQGCRRTACFSWFDLQTKTDITTLTVSQLRWLARQKGIVKYHHLDKATLLMELSKCP